MFLDTLQIIYPPDDSFYVSFLDGHWMLLIDFGLDSTQYGMTIKPWTRDDDIFIFKACFDYLHTSFRIESEF